MGGVILTDLPYFFAFFVVLAVVSLFWPLFALMAFVVSLPFEAVVFLTPTSTITRLFGFVLLVTFLWGVLSGRLIIKFSGFFIAMGFLVGLAALSVSFHAHADSVRFFSLVQCWIMVLVVPNIVTRRIHLHVFGVLLSAASIVSFFLSDYFLGSEISETTGRLGMLGENVNQSAFVCGFAFILNWYIFANSKSNLLRAMICIMNGFLFLLTILTGSRGILFAISIAFVLMSVAWFWRKRPVGIIVTSIVIALAWLWLINLDVFNLPDELEVYRYALLRLQEFLLGTGEGMHTYRYVIWSWGMQLFLESPLFGTGIGSFQSIIGWSSHDTWLQISCDLGLLGLLSILAPIGLSFRRVLKSTDITRSERCFWLGILSFALCAALFDDLLTRKLFWFALSLIWVNLEHDKSTPMNGVVTEAQVFDHINSRTLELQN